MVSRSYARTYKADRPQAAAADSRIRRRIFVSRKSAEKNTVIRIIKRRQHSNKDRISLF